MALELSIHLPDDGYTRLFSAEIDVLTGDQILVRGRMSDHRFAFEHVWKLQTPEYEVIEASARQLAGDPSDFDPELCERYAAIEGIRVGRGFSKRVITELGDLPGKREHLWLAIEMARVGQQVYILPDELEGLHSPASEDATEIARQSWRKDRAYMPDLANSCYTYRDESESLFARRDVRCGFDPAFYRPEPGSKRVFWRDKRLSVRRNGQGMAAFPCSSSMQDSIHDISIDFDLATDGTITNAASRGLRLPYHGICEDAQLRTAGLNGLRVTEGYILQFADRIGGSTGCTHLFDLSIDCLRLFNFL